MKCANCTGNACNSLKCSAVGCTLWPRRTGIAIGERARRAVLYSELFHEETQGLAGIVNERREIDAENDRERCQRQHQGETKIAGLDRNCPILGIGLVKKNRLTNLA